MTNDANGVLEVRSLQVCVARGQHVTVDFSLRPGEAVHTSARLLNQSKEHGYKLVRPGNGCQFAYFRRLIQFPMRSTARSSITL